MRVHRSLSPQLRDGEVVAKEQDVAAPRELSVREERIRRRLDVSRGVGLEIGPLFSPLVLRGEADIRYVDIRSAADLREHYKGDPAVKLDDIVDADYILIQADGSVLSVGEAAAAGAPFDWILASHVIEHIPDLISWFGTSVRSCRLEHACPWSFPTVATASMRCGRRQQLVTFCWRTTTGIRGRRPEPCSTISRAWSPYPATDLWDGKVPDSSALIHTVEQAAGMLERSRAGEYMDSHVWLFTPAEFVNQMSVLSRLGLLDFALVDIIPTAPGELE